MTLKETDHDVIAAKAHLLKDGIYDQLVGAIKQILEKDADNLQHALVRHNIISPATKTTEISDKIKVIIDESSATKNAKNCKDIFDNIRSKNVDENNQQSVALGNTESVQLQVLPNVMESQNFFRQCGVGLSEGETIKVYLAIKDFLSHNKNVGFCRFWGKMLGLEKNYFIIETTEIEISRPEMPAEDQSLPPTRESAASSDSLPERDYRPPVQIAPEFKAGPNRFVYYACTELNGNSSWQKLPDVTPTQILAARDVCKYLTGNLENQMTNCFPNFPGTEANFLRAQISRISASTIIAPAGRLVLAGEEEDMEEEDDDAQLDAGELVLSKEFEELTALQLLELDSWVHIRQALSQQQARTAYWKPPKEPKRRDGPHDSDEEEEEEEEDEDEDDEELEIEEPVPILRELSLDGKNEDDEDANNNAAEEGIFNGKEYWTKRVSSKILKHAIVCLKNNLWPGAYSFAKGDKFESVYIGHGIKANLPEYTNFEPKVIDAFQIENDLQHHAKDCVELSDPTVEEEAAMRERMGDGEDEAEDGEDEEAEEEGEEEEEEEDDE